MTINCENMIVTPNEDGTYKLELLNCPFKDSNGEEINGMITFPRVSKDGVNSFKNENVIPIASASILVAILKGNIVLKSTLSFSLAVSIEKDSLIILAPILQSNTNAIQ